MKLKSAIDKNYLGRLLLSCGLLFLSYLVPVYLLDSNSSHPIIIFSFLFIKSSIWFVWIRGGILDRRYVNIVLLSCLIVSSIFVIRELLISTMALNLILVAYAVLFILEALIYLAIAGLFLKNKPNLIFLMLNMVLLLYSLFRFFSEDIPFGYGP